MNADLQKLLVVLSLFGFPLIAKAEFPALEKSLAPQVSELVQQVGDQPVWVLARNVTGLNPPWNVTAAIQTEIVAGLAKAGKQGHDVGNDPIMDLLMNSEKSFNSNDLKIVQRQTKSGYLVVAEMKKLDGSPVLVMSLISIDDGTEKWNSETKLEPSALALDPNLPELNQQVLKFVQHNLGKQVGSGNSWALVAEAIKAVGGKRGGLYHFGRLLGPNEAWLPGDFVQFEHVKFHAQKSKRRANLTHSSAIVQKILGNGEVEIVHQGFNGGSIEPYIIKAKDLQEGRILVFRPDDGSSNVPEPLPRRTFTPTPKTNSDGTIDLLQTLDPDLDFVQGYWHKFEGPLKPINEEFARLQIPVDLPKSYTLNFRVRRISGEDTFGIGVVVDGHQTMIAIDSYGGKITGLHELSGRKANANETTKKMQVFQGDEWLDIECRVTPNSIVLKTKDTTQINWTGNASALSNNERFQVPNKAWLFLAAHNSVYEIAKATLTVN